jgi:hypothetical protein
MERTYHVEIGHSKALAERKQKGKVQNSTGKNRMWWWLVYPRKSSQRSQFEGL